MKVTAKTTTYTMKVEELKIMFAKELLVEPEQVSIKFITVPQGDDRFGPTYNETVGIEVTVDETKGKK